jgi:hypothetical protein
MLNIIKSLFKDIQKQQSAQYRIVKDTIFDEILMEHISIYYLEKRVGLNWYSVIERPFYTYGDCIKYYHKLMEYLRLSETKYEYLDNVKIES